MIAKYARGVPGSEPLALALAVIVAGHLVDSSPLSTIGGLCAFPAPAKGRTAAGCLAQTLIWGLAMSVVGALWCLLFYGGLFV